MPYYMAGDYYTGDYYTGDPGLLSWGGKLLRGALGAVPGVGPVISTVGSILTSRSTKRIAAAVGPPVIGAVAGAAVESRMTRQPGPAPIMRMPGAGVAMPMMPGGAPGMRGYHMSKPRYAPPGRMHGGALIPSHLVRNRRMRVTNPRALRRALRRAHGFARLARKVMSFPISRPPRGRALFKHRRRKK